MIGVLGQKINLFYTKPLMVTKLMKLKNFVDNSYVDPATNSWIESFNPSTEQVFVIFN
jgi:hypothetical protein